MVARSSKSLLRYSNPDQSDKIDRIREPYWRALFVIKKFSQQNHELKALEKISELWSFWSFQDTFEILQRDQCHLLYLEDTANQEEWQGLIFYQSADIFTDLLFIYVNPNSRRLGIGEELLLEMIQRIKKESTQETLFLEVRVSNSSAQKMYEKIGMIKVEIKKSYYSNGEDGVIYKLPLKQN